MVTGPRPAEVSVGTTLPELTVRLTRADLVRYAGASTDFNPIHYSERFAAAVGLPGVIAHGMLTMASALRVVTDWVGDPTQVRSYFVRFTKPVVVPDDDDGVEVVFSGTVTALDGTVATVSLDAVCGDQKVLGAARAEVELQPVPTPTDAGTDRPVA
jgi:acyl dehydratase